MTQARALPEGDLVQFGDTQRSNWVRLRTLMMLRWIAIAGQLAAITVAQRLFDLQLELGLCVLAIGVSAVTNLMALFIFPKGKLLTEAELVGLLLFDVTQLSLLLALTGGLNNPFALLILAPVTISATALRMRSTLIVGAVAIVMISLVTWLHVPLRTEQGFIMRMPQDFVIGFWVAIVIGIGFVSAYTRRVTSEANAMSDALVATQMALAREQKLTDLGGVVAAAAHELGTPLATIKLVSAELVDDLEDERLREDAELIRQQADRCRDILRSMGRAGKDDRHLRRAPLGSVIEEAAEPHGDRGKALLYNFGPLPGAEFEQPVVLRRPEIIHGVRNLVQNAVDFAHGRVWIDARWSHDQISLRITDDGPGYPAHVLPRLGDPFLRRRPSGARRRRPGYEGMGLGLFIAKTLLERTGAELTFANGPSANQNEPERTGAMVEAVWPRGVISDPGDRDALGANPQITH